MAEIWKATRARLSTSLAMDFSATSERALTKRFTWQQIWSRSSMHKPWSCNMVHKQMCLWWRPAICQCGSTLEINIFIWWSCMKIINKTNCPHVLCFCIISFFLCITTFLTQYLWVYNPQFIWEQSESNSLFIIHLILVRRIINIWIQKSLILFRLVWLGSWYVWQHFEQKTISNLYF